MTRHVDVLIILHSHELQKVRKDRNFLGPFGVARSSFFSNNPLAEVKRQKQTFRRSMQKPLNWTSEV